MVIIFKIKPDPKTIFLAFTYNKSALGDYYRALSDELVNRGYYLKILTPGKRTHKEVHDTNPAIYTWPSYRPTKFRDACYLYKLARQFRPVMILANFSTVNISMLISCLLGIPIRLATYRTAAHFDFLSENFLKKQYVFKIRKSIAYRFATKVLPVAEILSEEIKQIYRVPDEKIQYFHNAIKDPGLSIKKNFNHDMELICVGGLKEGKGQDILLQAIVFVKKAYPNIHLSLVGSGDWQEHLLRLVSNCGIKENVSFWGNLPHPQVMSKISNSNILILPTRYDACPKVIIEAMSVKTPVIASNIGGIPELIRDGFDGFLVPPDNSEILAERIIYLLKYPEISIKMGKNAYERFLGKFELSQAVKRQADWMEAEIFRVRN